jgi:hypothetical protein
VLDHYEQYFSCLLRAVNGKAHGVLHPPLTLVVEEDTMNATRKTATTFAAIALLTAALFAPSANAQTAGLTLENLKNGSYQIPNSACGYTVVKLHEGKGTAQDVQVIFGRATFGKLTNKSEPGAVIHLAYKDQMFGWMQQIVFVVERKGKVLQIAELGLDEREQLKNIEFREGDALIETACPDASSGKIYKKCVKAELVERKEGCVLTATKYNWLTTDNAQEAAHRLVSLR